MKYLMIIVIVFAFYLIPSSIEAKVDSGVVFTPDMVIEIDKNGKLIFYPSATQLRSMGFNDMAIEYSGLSKGGITSDIVIKALELFIDDVAEKVCAFKYKPDSFELSIPGFVSANWKTKDVCKGK